jgi:hypothetical protein
MCVCLRICLQAKRLRALSDGRLEAIHIIRIRTKCTGHISSPCRPSQNSKLHWRTECHRFRKLYVSNNLWVSDKGNDSLAEQILNCTGATWSTHKVTWGAWTIAWHQRNLSRRWQNKFPYWPKSPWSNPGGDKMFRTRPDRSWGPLRLLYNAYRVNFPRVKRPGSGVNHLPLLAPRLKKEYGCTYTPSLGLRNPF